MKKKDFSLVAYRNLRLAFGLTCSPCLLLLGLYKILMLDSTSDEGALRNLKAHIYSLLYMDNGSVTCNDSQGLKWAYDTLPTIFSPYQIMLQQFYTNVNKRKKSGEKKY